MPLKDKSAIQKLLITALVALFVIQLFSIDKTNPPIAESKDFYSTVEMPSDVQLMLKKSCNDCHSHNVAYPWYTNVEPISWWVKGHINAGQQKLNFSTWNDYSADKKNHKLEECIEVMEDKRMPLKSYTWMHKGTALNEADREKLISFFRSAKNQ